ncbi:MAG: DinB family protein [Dehalococcoidia bacterium]
MTDIVQFLRGQMDGLHTLLDRVVADLTPEQVHYQARPGIQPIAFSLWRYVRTEDNIIRFVLQRRPTVWIEGGWPEKFGLDPRGQGTGMTDEAAAALRIASLDDWRRYQGEVWTATDAYLAALDPVTVDGQRVTIRPVGEMSLLDALGGMVLTHGYRHLGEIEYARGLLGLKGATI